MVAEHSSEPVVTGPLSTDELLACLSTVEHVLVHALMEWPEDQDAQISTALRVVTCMSKSVHMGFDISGPGFGYICPECFWGALYGV